MYVYRLYEEGKEWRFNYCFHVAPLEAKQSERKQHATRSTQVSTSTVVASFPRTEFRAISEKALGVSPTVNKIRESNGSWKKS